ncbi:MAG: peptidoglycan-binding protein [Stomatobaculum sp.]|nr:peptidoglycan-binding protein [Stomatobaculum sp.]
MCGSQRRTTTSGSRASTDGRRRHDERGGAGRVDQPIAGGKSMGVIEKAVAWAIDIAQDQRHGYSQTNRWGPDYDCSSLVIAAYEQAGIPVKKKGATYTGNMRAAFLACGFRDVTYAIGKASGHGLQAGDVLLNYAAHTCLYIGGGKVVNARTSEGNDQSGDQSGGEIRIQNYWDFPWDCVLRYGGSSGETGAKTGETGAGQSAAGSGSLKKGSRGEAVKALQRKLINAGYSVGPEGADGIFGGNTFKAVVMFQEDHGLTVTGEAGAETMEAFTDTVYAAAPGGTEGGKPVNVSEWPELKELRTGDRGPEVLFLQAALTLRGCDCGKQDGEFGPKTQAAVNRFKQDRGLKQDGVADRETWALLLQYKIPE